MKILKKLCLALGYISLIMFACFAIDYSRIYNKENPLFSFYKEYDISGESYPYNLYVGPLYYLKIENRTGTRSNIDIVESNKVEIGLWFKDSELVFEQEFTY